MTSEISEALDLQSRFRDAMGAVCTPVAVVTAIRDGMPFGTTVSAFASLSMTPPMMLVSLDRGSGLLAVMRTVTRFGVNILSSEQSELAGRFATKGGSAKFTDVGCFPDGDVPRLPRTAAFVVCRVSELVDAGDHVLVLGEVLESETAELPPLTYHRRGFGTHAPLAEVAG